MNRPIHFFTFKKGTVLLLFFYCFSCFAVQAVAQTLTRDSAAGRGEELKVYINQIGYLADGPKTAIVEVNQELLNVMDQHGPDSQFTMIDADDHKVVFKGSLSPGISIPDWFKDRCYFKADFSGLKRRGHYLLSVAINGKYYFGPPLVIGDSASVSGTEIKAILHYFRRQRAASPKEWAADRHLKLKGSTRRVDMRGGWCDASGDVSKYFSHLAYANFMSPQQTPLVTWSLVQAAERIPKLLHEWHLLDSARQEAIWGADYMMRALSDSDFFYMVVFSYFKNDPAAREIVGLEANSVTTTDYACAFREGAGMAIASLARISQWKVHGDFTSRQYLDGARRAFAHLLRYNRKYDDNGQENIIDDYCALMAATELWICTDSALYKDQARYRAENLVAKLSVDGYFRSDTNKTPGRPFWHGSDAGLPVVALVRYLDREKDPCRILSVKQAIRKALYAQVKLNSSVPNPFNYSRQQFLFRGKLDSGFFIPHENESGWWWQGENARLASLATAALVGGRKIAKEAEGKADLRFWDVPKPLAVFAADQLSWIAGCNPFGICFMYGFGNRNVPYMHSNYGHGSEIGGISNGITGANPDGGGIAFKTKDEGNEWRWTEQWLPHAAWYLQALTAGLDKN
ncbi:MAG TPA: glycoside hydrolase family 9 protein [Arachidicoccus sp.]|nr:glycoside hydrolase family 9 protein [Arachidicoccus sp.]